MKITDQIIDAHFRAMARVSSAFSPYNTSQDASDCQHCDGFGCVWNNADPTSGQWAACDVCEDTRGHP